MNKKLIAGTVVFSEPGLTRCSQIFVLTHSEIRVHEALHGVTITTRDHKNFRFSGGVYSITTTNAMRMRSTQIV
jgi:hypothetical protein